MPIYADFGGWVISTIAGWFVVTADTPVVCRLHSGHRIDLNISPLESPTPLCLQSLEMRYRRLLPGGIVSRYWKRSAAVQSLAEVAPKAMANLFKRHRSSFNVRSERFSSYFTWTRQLFSRDRKKGSFFQRRLLRSVAQKTVRNGRFSNICPELGIPERRCLSTCRSFI